MIRVILILLVLIVFLLVSALPLLIGEKCVWKNNENRQKEYALQVVKQVLRMVFRLTGSTLTVKGLENIPDMPVLYVGNHRSYFDIVTGYIVVPGQTGSSGMACFIWYSSSRQSICPGHFCRVWVCAPGIIPVIRPV